MVLLKPGFATEHVLATPPIQSDQEYHIGTYCSTVPRDEGPHELKTYSAQTKSMQYTMGWLVHPKTCFPMH